MIRIIFLVPLPSYQNNQQVRPNKSKRFLSNFEPEIMYAPKWAPFMHNVHKIVCLVSTFLKTFLLYRESSKGSHHVVDTTKT